MKLTTKQKIKSTFLYLALLGLTILLGTWSIVYILNNVEQKPIKAECTNIPEAALIPDDSNLQNFVQNDIDEEEKREKEKEQIRIQ
jgi:hypothetical protein